MEANVKRKTPVWLGGSESCSEGNTPQERIGPKCQEALQADDGHKCEKVGEQKLHLLFNTDVNADFVFILNIGLFMGSMSG